MKLPKIINVTSIMEWRKYNILSLGKFGILCASENLVVIFYFYIQIIFD